MKETYQSDNDFLLSAVQHGDQKAFDTLFRRYYPMLCAYGHRFVELEDAEEIVEDSLLWIWENRETLVIESSLNSYLFKMVYRRTSLHISMPPNGQIPAFMKKCRKCCKIRTIIRLKNLQNGLKMLSRHCPKVIGKLL